MTRHVIQALHAWRVTTPMTNETRIFLSFQRPYGRKPSQGYEIIAKSTQETVGS